MVVCCCIFASSIGTLLVGIYNNTIDPNPDTSFVFSSDKKGDLQQSISVHCSMVPVSVVAGDSLWLLLGCVSAWAAVAWRRCAVAALGSVLRQLASELWNMLIYLYGLVALSDEPLFYLIHPLGMDLE